MIPMVSGVYRLSSPVIRIRGDGWSLCTDLDFAAALLPKKEAINYSKYGHEV